MIAIKYVVLLMLAALLLCLVVIGWSDYRQRRLLNRLDKLLDAAMNGSFCEQTFDESMMSALESKLARYLAYSETSAKHVQAEKDKIKALITDISHQTKTPIANILLYGQLLQEQDLPEESKNCVAALQGQAEKLNFLIASLVKLSRLETGILTLHPVEQPIEPILREIARQYGPKAEARQIQLIVDDTAETSVLDAKWTAEALGNLVDNAVKYTEVGGTVQVTVRAYELFCRIDVIDNGRGIAEEEQAKVFARFYRSPAVADQEGVGIGLYLTRQILASQGGYIKVASKLGQGSVFSVFLQRAA